ncbi:hypothetical protein THAOC_03670, partial [Thalassiosira oceanica]
MMMRTKTPSWGRGRALLRRGRRGAPALRIRGLPSRQRPPHGNGVLGALSGEQPVLPWPEPLGLRGGPLNPHDARGRHRERRVEARGAGGSGPSPPRQGAGNFLVGRGTRRPASVPLLEQDAGRGR